MLTGSGTYILKPTIKTLPMSTAGAISGTVSPTGVTTAIYAIQSPDTLGTTVAKADGSFKVSVLAPGTYALAFDPLTTYRDTTITGVTVTAGQTTNVGTVQLTALPIP